VLKHALNQRRVKNMMMQTSVLKVLPAAQLRSKAPDKAPVLEILATFEPSEGPVLRTIRTGELGCIGGIDRRAVERRAAARSTRAIAEVKANIPTVPWSFATSNHHSCSRDDGQHQRNDATYDHICIC
jgi:hypothetical protein